MQAAIENPPELTQRDQVPQKAIVPGDDHESTVTDMLDVLVAWLEPRCRSRTGGVVTTTV